MEVEGQNSKIDGGEEKEKKKEEKGNSTPAVDKMSQEVLKYAFYFLVVGATIWASSWAEISCCMWTGERQSTKLRIKYLEAALSQGIQFFDTEVRTSLYLLSTHMLLMFKMPFDFGLSAYIDEGIYHL